MRVFDHEGLRSDLVSAAASAVVNAPAPVLVAEALRGGQGVLTADGALSVATGIHTGRSPKDKFIVRDETTRHAVWWDNSAAMAPEDFETLWADAQAHLAGAPIHVQDLWAGADPRHTFGVTVISESAWHALFIRHLLIREAPGEKSAPAVTILHVPSLTADPARHKTRTGTAIALDLTHNRIVIAGTFYAGEIKKAVFSLFNFHAPAKNILPMHCSANIGQKGDVALFFGLSGTGKTTLSNDPERLLIGDDEHGWSADGVFNLEGGCYAKTVNLSETAEPEIYGAARSFGTVLENLVIDPETLLPDFADISLTENTRAAYGLETLPAVAAGGTGATPKTVVFLTADAFGVLPPIARLTPEQAVYHFLSGYTAKIAGTERGVSEPQATFSACFGAPFMALHPTVYGDLLAERLKASGAATWLINTGWTGGGYGVGKRIAIAATRRLLNAALSGELDRGATRIDPVFGLAVPAHVEGVDDALLEPRLLWSDPLAYDRTAEKLVGLFATNFAQFGPQPRLTAAGPRLRQAAE
jgi:phosphoenolpyruvate carboxykinase (ATP)